ncbi:MAG: hypothetical protein R3362_04145 [Rhodothermales bacterium]|nr:hypothetical protein [Rhodothermales bacterium]
MNPAESYTKTRISTDPCANAEKGNEVTITCREGGAPDVEPPCLIITGEKVTVRAKGGLVVLKVPDSLLSGLVVQSPNKPEKHVCINDGGAHVLMISKYAPVGIYELTAVCCSCEPASEEPSAQFLRASRPRMIITHA